MSSYCVRPLPSVLRRAISLSTVHCRPGRLLAALAAAALLVYAGATAKPLNAQENYAGSGFTASGAGATTSSSLTVSDATGTVKAVTLKLNDVTSSTSGNNFSVYFSAFVLKGPGGKIILLAATGDAIDGGGLNGLNITVEDGANPAPLTGTSGSDEPWPQTGSITVEPSSYFQASVPESVPSNLSSYEIPQQDGSATLNSTNGTFSGTTGDGTWTLSIINEDTAPDPITIGSWTLTLTYNAATAVATTTTLSSNNNPAFVTAPNNSITFTATVSSTSTVNAGTVDFTSNGSTISGCGTASVSNGTATCTTSLAEGLSPIEATYSGSTDFSGSTTTSAYEELVEQHSTQSGDTWCNPGSLTVPLGSLGPIYPSVIKVSGYPAGTTVANLEVELMDVTGTIFAQHLLVAPDGTHNLDFFDAGFNPSSADIVSSPGDNLNFYDNNFTTPTPVYPDDNNAAASGNYLASDETSASNSFPSSSAPAEDSSIPQVPGSINYGYDPFDGSLPGRPASETFGSNFSGALANGDWALYPYETVNGTETIGSWCIVLALNPSSGAPTTTTVTSSANPAVAKAPVTLGAAVTATSGGSAVTSGGTVTFLENGTAPAGTIGGDNVVNLSTSTGQSSFTTGAVSSTIHTDDSGDTMPIYEGDYLFTGNYSGTSSDDASDSAAFWQRFNTATTSGTGSGSSINFCNAGAVLLDEDNNKGAFQPNPSIIQVTGLPGTVATVTLSLNDFYTSNTGAINETEALIEGPTGKALDFFSNTGDSSTQLGTTASPLLNPLTFADGNPTNPTVPDSGSYLAGTYEPTAYGSSADTFTSSSSGFYPAPTAGSIAYAQPHGSGTFNTGPGNVFGGTNPNGTWSLFFNTTNNVPAEGAQGGWCLNFTENPVAVTVDENHSGSGTGGDFVQGETANAYITAALSVNPTSPSVSPGDPLGTSPLTVTDTLQTGLSWPSPFNSSSYSGAHWSCSASGQTVTCTDDFAVSSLSVGQNPYPTLTLNVNVSPSASSPISNYVSVSGAGVTPTNSTTDSIPVDSSQIAPAITSGSSTTFTVGTTSSFTVTASGSPAPTFTETGSLPSGVSLATDGTLSGTPGAGTAGSYPITITANNGVAPNATQSFTLTVDQAPAITSGSATTFTVGTLGSFTATASGSPAPTFTETGSLPSGVTLATNGTLSGTPGAGTGGSYPITITASNGVGTNATQSFTLTVDQAPAITSGSARTFTVGTLGSFTATASGFPAPTFTETGALPSGVTLATNGTLSGTPGAGTGGPYLITITASNGVGTNATQSFTLTVDQAPAITSGSATTFTVGILGSFTATASGFPAPTFSVTAGSLPSGVTLATNGTLSGTPGAGTGGSYPITITASNGVAPNATQSFTLTVDQAPAITSANNTAFMVGVPGTFTVTTTAVPAAALSLAGALPSGITFIDNGNGTGTLAGTAAAGTAGPYLMTITANDGVTPNATQTFTLTINSLPNYVVNTTADDASGNAANCPNGGAVSPACTLRDALAAAANAGAANITFASAAFPAPSGATIVLGTAGTLTIPLNTTVQGLTTGSGASLTNLVTVSGGNGSSGQFSVFTVNSGTNGAAIANLTISGGGGAAGGGINNAGALTVTGSTISGNSGNRNGGGIWNSGTLKTVNSTISGNSVTNFNQTTRGGGIWNSGTLTATGSTISGNSAGTVSSSSSAYGGGISSNGVLTLINSTVSGNSASEGSIFVAEGGGIDLEGGAATLADSIVAGNRLGQSIGNVYYADINGNYIDDGGNQASNDPSSASTIAIDLAPLGNYGGPTQTMIPLPGSPAICAGLASTAATAGITADQRGLAMSLTTSNASTYTGVGGYCASGSLDTGAVQTDYSIAFAQQPPAAVVTGSTFSPSPTVQLSESGSPISQSGDSISLAATAGALSGTSTEATSSTGLATFAGLSIATVESNDELAATLTLNSSPSVVLTADSSQFNVELPVPSVTATLSPATGPTTGGTIVTVTGTNFTGATAVDFGGVPAISFTVNSPTQITATSPVFATAQTVDLTVTTPSGTSATSSTDQYIYFVPVSTSLTPSVTPGTTFVYANQPTISAALNPSTATGALTATLDGATPLALRPAGGGIFNIALPATPLTVGSHSIALAFTGTGVYESTTGNISLTVSTPTLVVNTATDDLTGTASNCTSSPEGTCTLRDALTAASNGGAANISFATQAFPAPTGATILLGTAGTLTIPSNTTIQGLTTGSGASLTNLVTVDGAGGASGQFAIFTVNSGATGVAIANLNLQNGKGGVGGAIYNNGGSLTVAATSFSLNTGSTGAAIWSSGTITVSDSTFSQNSATNGGAAISNSTGTLTVTGSTFSQNSARTGGGAIWNNGTETVTDSTFFENSAPNAGGGALTNVGGTATVGNSIFSQNTAKTTGSAVWNSGTVIESYNDFDNDTVFGFTASGTDQSGAANLATLGSYGGPTPTLIPLPASAAICAGSAANIPVGVITDQRGEPNTNTTYPGYSGGSPCVDAGAVQTNYAISFTTPASNLAPNTPMSPNPAVTLDESGSPFTGVAVTIPLTLTSSPSGATLTGGSAATSAGVATYSTLAVNQPGTGDQLTATLALNSSPTVSISAQSGTFNVSKIAPTLSFAPSPVSQTYGTAVIAGSLDATASYNNTNVAGTFAYTTTVNSNPVTLAAGVTMLPAGSYTITATFTPSDPTVYTGTSTTASYTVNGASLTITASNGTMTYGGTAPTITASYSGFVNGDSATSLTTQPICSTTAVSNSAAGSYPSSCSGAVDANYTISYTAGAVTVKQAGLTIAANNATKIYGTADPTFTGAVTGQQNGDTIAESFSTAATLLSPVGTYPIVPSVTGSNLSDYTQTIVDATLQVTQAASITTVGLSSPSITPGQSETITVTVASATAGTPTGSVNIYDGTTLLSTVSLDNTGAASYTTASFAPGAGHAISAVYSGDINFVGSTSSANTGVTVAPLDFTMAIVGSSSATVVPGQSATFQVTVTPLYGMYAGTVDFAITGLPAGAKATFSPSSIAANGGPQTVTVTIGAAPATVASRSPAQPSPTRRAAPFALAFLLIFGLGAVRRRGRAVRRLFTIVLILAGCATATLVSGCVGGGFFAQAPQTYNLTITATAGNLAHSVNVTANVQ